jgi:hypothetical protein
MRARGVCMNGAAASFTERTPRLVQRPSIDPQWHAPPQGHINSDGREVWIMPVIEHIQHQLDVSSELFRVASFRRPQIMRGRVP